MHHTQLRTLVDHRREFKIFSLRTRVRGGQRVRGSDLELMDNDIIVGEERPARPGRLWNVDAKVTCFGASISETALELCSMTGLNLDNLVAVEKTEGIKRLLKLFESSASMWKVT